MVRATAPGSIAFYTDDPALTEVDRWHFNEFDILQLQYPNVRQNAANYKLNYGLPFNLKLIGRIVMAVTAKPLAQ